MRRTMLKSKIHRATVTESSADCEGSLTVDRDLLDAAGILPHEQALVGNLTNGKQCVMYVLPAERGSGIVAVNGDAAYRIAKGDAIAIAAFTELRGKAARKHEPTVVLVDESNKLMMAVPPSQVPATTPMGAVPRKRKKPTA